MSNFWGAFHLLCFFVLAYISLLRKKVIVRHNDITVIPTLGKRKKYNFNDIKLIRKKVNTSRGLIILYTVYSDKKLFTFDGSYFGSRFFIQKAKQFNIEFTTNEK